MKITPLYHIHLELGAKMFTSAVGYAMPAKYTTVEEEHRNVRERVGMMDISLMGRLDIKGKDAFQLIQKLIVHDAAGLSDGQALYTTMCNDQGMIMDDVTVWRFGSEYFRIITSSMFRARTSVWVEDHSENMDAYLTDVSSGLGMISVQGPRSRELLQDIMDIDLSQLKFFRFATGKFGTIPGLIARIGFSGELGYECYVNTEDTVATWEMFMDAGKPFGLMPYGFDVLDTLRWEKGFIFYGFDATEKHNPYECRLSEWIRYDKSDFIGREALLKIRDRGVARKLMGLEVAGDNVAAEQQPLKADGKTIGSVVVGFFAPYVGKNLAYAYLDSEYAKAGNQVSLEIEGADTNARVVEMPFYDPEGKRMRT